MSDPKKPRTSEEYFAAWVEECERRFRESIGDEEVEIIDAGPPLIVQISGEEIRIKPKD